MEGQVREKCVPLLMSQSVEGLLPGKLLLNLALIFDKQNRDGLYGAAFIPFFKERVVRVGIPGWMALYERRAGYFTLVIQGRPVAWEL